MMFTKLDTIHRITKEDYLKKFQPSFSFKTKIIEGGLTKEQRNTIKDVNKYFLKKLHNQVSCYNRSKWDEDYKNVQKLKKNICEYPSIDFHKTIFQAGDSNNNNQISRSTLYDTQKNYFNSTRFKPIKSFSQESYVRSSSNNGINYNSNNSETKKTSDKNKENSN